MAGLLVALLLLFGWGLRLRARGSVESGPAPDFTLTTYDGETITLSDLPGQVVIINSWASWCPPCHDEAAYLEATWRKFRDLDVVFLGIDYLDAEPNARAYIEEYGITYPNGPDIGARILAAYRISGVPETFYVDQSGQLRGMKIGALFPPESVWSQVRRFYGDCCDAGRTAIRGCNRLPRRRQLYRPVCQPRRWPALSAKLKRSSSQPGATGRDLSCERDGDGVEPPRRRSGGCLSRLALVGTARQPGS